MTEELVIPVEDVEAYVANPVEYLKHHILKQQGEKPALLRFAEEAWSELKAIGRNDVFCFERFQLMARDLGLEG